MTFEYKFSSHSIFSPGYLLCDVPQCVKIELLDAIENISKIEDDCRETLAGHINQEYYLSMGNNIKYLTETMSGEYDKIFLNGISPFMDNFSYSKKGTNPLQVKYNLTNLWVNYSKKYDFNPVHSHYGIYSFVIWVKIPYDLNEEKKVYNKLNGNSQTSLFNFYYTDFLGKMQAIHLNVDKTWEWKMVFFPSQLNHSVHPFYTSDDYRISISGNVGASSF